ncbi:MAG: phosphoribosylanthranilate isomerase [Porticoccaceae bacterium]
MRTRVKICGITSVEDALAAIDAGADALGLVFYRPSPRYVEPEVAAEIIARVPAFVTTMGLFVDASKDEILSVLLKAPFDFIQFHGNESVADCERIGKPYIKALRVGNEDGGLYGQALRNMMNEYKSARGLLLDTYQKGVPGGTGERFDWDQVPEPGPDDNQYIVLAGGLTPENVAEAVESVRPYAVDVSGGVESAPGRKDADRIRAFLDAVRHADSSLDL